MYRIPEIAVTGWPGREGKRSEAQSHEHATPLNSARPFNLLRWISILGFIAIVPVSVGFAAILSHFMAREILDHDATLTNQFIASVAETQSREANLGPNFTVGQILDERPAFAVRGIDREVAREVRTQFYDHLRFLPDVLLADVFARDRKIIWSTNPSLIGRNDHDEDQLEKAFAAQVVTNVDYIGRHHTREEQEFVRRPEKLYIENYVPLADPRGQVVAVAKIYKEPGSLLRAIHRGNILVWTCTALGAVLLYLSLFWVIRRADVTLADQQQRLVEAEALCVIGEMSAAVAHGIRNPLATIRTSAELALEGDLASARKNATDIIFQIDRLGKWVRDLLAFSRPLSGENQKIELVAMVEECLANFATQFRNCAISFDFVKPGVSMPPVTGERGLACQALGNVVANAIEAMGKGGSLRLELQPTAMPRGVSLVVTDTGAGMTPAEVELMCKPYYTTKRNGLGLGMPLVKRIMERFGGTIEVRSRVGEGTRVSLNFRVA